MMTTLLNKKNAVGIIIFMLLSLAGCAGKNSIQSYLRPEANFSFIRKVAVLPLENYSNNNPIAVRCRQMIISEVMSAGLFDVVDKMQVDSLLREEAIPPGSPINNAILRRLGNRLGVQGFILGSVDEASERKQGAAIYLDLSVSLRLIESESGLVVWQASGRENGYSIWGRLFGLESKDPFEVTLKLVRDLLRTLGNPAG